MKDIAMANEAGITSIHAKYGEAHKRKSYDLLREVTHWSKENVEHEKKGEVSQTIPEHVLNASFSELLSLFAYGGREDIHVEAVLPVWEKTVEVQMHFNELSLKIRSLGVTVLGAILTAAALSLKDHVSIGGGGVSIPAYLPLLLIAIFVWPIFWMMDQFWYHRLLKGAVDHARILENDLKQKFPYICLTASIGASSVVKW